ncbi:MAG: FtsW/RodA/SpoVE family cell cycle protein [Chlamydiales bacterium]
MWNHHSLHRIDWRIIVVILSLMTISLLVISSTDPTCISLHENSFFTPKVVSQLRRFFIGWGVFLLFAGMDYNKIREWAWILYGVMLISLIGLFLTPSIQSVHRWFKIPIIGASIQPSEYAKLIVVIALSWFLEKTRSKSSRWTTALFGSLIAIVPFLLILKQPDLGTAFVLCPITLIMFYLGNIHPRMVRCILVIASLCLLFILLIFLEVFSHEQMYPYATKFLKEYQYERLNPHNHHQWASCTAIGLGGVTGRGWRNSEFTGRGWLPYGYTDSVFPAFGEEFGFLGLVVMLILFYSLIYFGFQVTIVAKDHFGRMLSAGITIYLAIHIILNIGMMCRFFPVTGVPLPLISYGGSSIFVTMAALGILQSVYSQRFMF